MTSDLRDSVATEASRIEIEEDCLYPAQSIEVTLDPAVLGGRRWAQAVVSLGF